MRTIISKWKTLLGFDDEGQALAHVTQQGIPYSQQEIERFKQEIRGAKEFVSRLPARKDDGVELRPIPEAWKVYLDELSKEPLFQEHLVGIRKHEFALVPIRDLTVFQRAVNLDYITSLVERAPAPDDFEGLLKFCLPTNKSKMGEQVLAGFNTETNTINIATDNLDFRVLGNVQGEDPASGRKFFGFAIGGGLPQMGVAVYRGRHILKNGVHRAYALALKGHQFLPALVLDVDSYSATGAQRAGFFGIDVVMGEKPPRIGDFFTGAALDVNRFRLKMVVSIHAEVQAIPV